MEPLAHSARLDKNVSAQTYREHVDAVRAGASTRIAACLEYFRDPDPGFALAAELASEFHDLGKLEATNQSCLCETRRGSLPVNHVDAGVAHLKGSGHVEAALSAYAHHIGLPDLPEEQAKEARSRQDSSQSALRDARIKEDTDRRLDELLTEHHRWISGHASGKSVLQPPRTGFERRLLLSCLVDADHSDTARHYGNECPRSAPAGRWAERLESLDRYVRSLEDGPRSRDRDAVYQACKSAPTDSTLVYCDSPVGSGKTTAIMAYLLRAAKELDLRHIFVVLPYTNIIDQSLLVYRQALVLLGEDPEEIVVAHHHQAEFSEPALRHLTTLWEAPIIVTTAVQFFETLASHETARLRKLHQLPGSAVFIDEAHAAIPIRLWPYMWNQIRKIGEEWNCRFVLGSGSLSRFWENEKILNPPERIPSLIPPEISAHGNDAEHVRVRYQSRSEALNLSQLVEWVSSEPGPRLVVMNTVQSAAVVAREMKTQGVDVEHLSTALTPCDRRQILNRVRKKLFAKANTNWLLVATSCVEAGVDLSFVTAFRERARATSLVQIGGRVNRHADYRQAVVWDFVVVDSNLPPHPDFRDSRVVVSELFQEGLWSENTTALMTTALEREFIRKPQTGTIEEILKAEKIGRYPEVSKMTRVISTDTRLVVVETGLAGCLRGQSPVVWKELIEHSVQLHPSRISKLDLPPILGDEIFAWPYEYDWDCLGVMAGILRQRDGLREGVFMV